jgi:signal transduction histidine kinase
LNLRSKLLVAFTATVVLAVGVVAALVTSSTQAAFDELDRQRTEALVAQFRREFARRGEEVARRVKGIAESEATLQMAIDLSRPNSDASIYVSDAIGLARNHQLDFLELVTGEGIIISSAQWPARFGYQNEWIRGAEGAEPHDWTAQGAFLRREETRSGPELALLAVSAVNVGEKRIYIIGGHRLDREFLASLVLPSGMRALLYRNLDPAFSASLLTDARGPAESAETLAPLIERIRRQPGEVTETLQWTADAASGVTLHAIPLQGSGRELLGVLLVESSRGEIVALTRRIRMTAALVGALGVAFGLLLSWWAAARFSRPVQELAAGARAVSAGNWSARVAERGSGEVAELARAFNHMTRQLVEQRERLLQAERVAAWRELARRLAHELKNPLFPLQITVENLQRARDASPAAFDEVFRESTATLLGELDKLKGIVARFSDFARMPAPEYRLLDVNSVVRDTVKLFQAQFSAPGRPAITPEVYLEPGSVNIEADADLLRRALQNLILNAMDAMTAGGTLTLRVRRAPGGALIEVADTGAGLTREECERLFTPYYTSKLHGTGLGLAIVQSVVSDHKGRITVESEPGRGTSFRILLPARPAEFSPYVEMPAPAAEPQPAEAAAAAASEAAAAESVAAQEAEAAPAAPEAAEAPAAAPAEEILMPAPACAGEHALPSGQPLALEDSSAPPAPAAPEEAPRWSWGIGRSEAAREPVDLRKLIVEPAEEAAAETPSAPPPQPARVAPRKPLAPFTPERVATREEIEALLRASAAPEAAGDELASAAGEVAAAGAVEREDTGAEVAAATEEPRETPSEPQETPPPPPRQRTFFSWFK